MFKPRKPTAVKTKRKPYAHTMYRFDQNAGAVSRKPLSKKYKQSLSTPRPINWARQLGLHRPAKRSEYIVTTFPYSSRKFVKGTTVAHPVKRVETEVACKLLRKVGKIKTRHLSRKLRLLEKGGVANGPRQVRVRWHRLGFSPVMLPTQGGRRKAVDRLALMVSRKKFRASHFLRTKKRKNKKQRKFTATRAYRLNRLYRRRKLAYAKARRKSANKHRNWRYRLQRNGGAAGYSPCGWILYRLYVPIIDEYGVCKNPYTPVYGQIDQKALYQLRPRNVEPAGYYFHSTRPRKKAVKRQPTYAFRRTPWYVGTARRRRNERLTRAVAAPTVWKYKYHKKPAQNNVYNNKAVQRIVSRRIRLQHRLVTSRKRGASLRGYQKTVRLLTTCVHAAPTKSKKFQALKITRRVTKKLATGKQKKLRRKDAKRALKKTLKGASKKAKRVLTPPARKPNSTPKLNAKKPNAAPQLTVTQQFILMCKQKTSLLQPQAKPKLDCVWFSTNARNPHPTPTKGATPQTQTQTKKQQKGNNLQKSAKTGAQHTDENKTLRAAVEKKVVSTPPNPKKPAAMSTPQKTAAAVKVSPKVVPAAAAKEKKTPEDVKKGARTIRTQRRARRAVRRVYTALFRVTKKKRREIPPSFRGFRKLSLWAQKRLKVRANQYKKRNRKWAVRARRLRRKRCFRRHMRLTRRLRRVRRPATLRVLQRHSTRRMAYRSERKVGKKTNYTSSIQRRLRVLLRSAVLIRHTVSRKKTCKLLRAVTAAQRVDQNKKRGLTKTHLNKRNLVRVRRVLVRGRIVKKRIKLRRLIRGRDGKLRRQAKKLHRHIRRPHRLRRIRARRYAPQQLLRLVVTTRRPNITRKKLMKRRHTPRATRSRRVHFRKHPRWKRTRHGRRVYIDSRHKHLRRKNSRRRPRKWKKYQKRFGVLCTLLPEREKNLVWFKAMTRTPWRRTRLRLAQKNLKTPERAWLVESRLRRRNKQVLRKSKSLKRRVRRVKRYCRARLRRVYVTEKIGPRQHLKGGKIGQATIKLPITKARQRGLRAGILKGIRDTVSTLRQARETRAELLKRRTYPIGAVKRLALWNYVRRSTSRKLTAPKTKRLENLVNRAAYRQRCVRRAQKTRLARKARFRAKKRNNRPFYRIHFDLRRKKDGARNWAAVRNHPPGWLVDMKNWEKSKRKFFTKRYTTTLRNPMPRQVRDILRIRAKLRRKAQLRTKHANLKMRQRIWARRSAQATQWRLSALGGPRHARAKLSIPFKKRKGTRTRINLSKIAATLSLKSRRRWKQKSRRWNTSLRLRYLPQLDQLAPQRRAVLTKHAASPLLLGTITHARNQLSISKAFAVTLARHNSRRLRLYGVSTRRAIQWGKTQVPRTKNDKSTALYNLRTSLPALWMRRSKAHRRQTIATLGQRKTGRLNPKTRRVNCWSAVAPAKVRATDKISQLKAAQQYIIKSSKKEQIRVAKVAAAQPTKQQRRSVQIAKAHHVYKPAQLLQSNHTVPTRQAGTFAMLAFKHALAGQKNYTKAGLTKKSNVVASRVRMSTSRCVQVKRGLLRKLNRIAENSSITLRGWKYRRQARKNRRNVSKKTRVLRSKAGVLRFSLPVPRILQNWVGHRSLNEPFDDANNGRALALHVQRSPLSIGENYGLSSLRLSARLRRLVHQKHSMAQVRRPRTFVQNYERFRSARNARTVFTRKLAVTTQGKRNTRLPVPLVWSVRSYGTKDIAVRKTGGVNLLRPTRRLRRNKQLRRKRQQIVYIERQNMAPMNRWKKKTLRSALRRAPHIKQAAQLSTRLNKIMKTPRAVQAASKLTSNALKLLQTKLVGRKGSADLMLMPGTLGHLQISKSQPRLLPSDERGLGARTDHLKMRVITLRVKQNKSTVDKKVNALRYQRSVRRMSKLGHQLSGFTYRYPLRARRRTVPRRDAYVLQRKWPSHKQLRNRQLVSERREYLGLPQILYPDLAYVGLQYRRGSVDSVGYNRFRRVFRVKSPTNRWWRVVNFENPFGSKHARVDLHTRKADVTAFYAPTPRPVTKRYEVNKEPIRKKLRRIQTALSLGTNNAAIDRTFSNENLWSNDRWQDIDTSKPDAHPLFSQNDMVGLHPALWNAVTRGLSSSAKNSLQTVIYSRYLIWRSEFHVPTFIDAANKAHWVRRESAQFLERELNTLIHGTSAVSTSVREETALTTQHRTRTEKLKTHLWESKILPKFQQHLSGETPNIRDKGNDALYSRWLNGFEGWIKRSQISHYPPGREPHDSQTLTFTGRRQPRFPSAGMRRFTYERVVHAYSRRAAPARLRRVSRSRFIEARPRYAKDWKGKAVVYDMSRSIRQRRRQARLQSLNAYPTKAWQRVFAHRQKHRKPKGYSRPTELAALSDSDKVLSREIVNRSYPTNYGQPSAGGVRRRFASLPVQAQFRVTRRLERRLQSRKFQTLRVAKTGILRAAIRRRLDERPIVDLRKNASRRRTLSDLYSLPWRARKKRRALSRVAQFGLHSAKKVVSMGSKTHFWTAGFGALCGLARKKLKSRKRVVSVSDELLKTGTTIMRSKRAYNITNFKKALKHKRRRKHLRRRRQREYDIADTGENLLVWQSKQIKRHLKVSRVGVTICDRKRAHTLRGRVSGYQRKVRTVRRSLAKVQFKKERARRARAIAKQLALTSIYRNVKLSRDGAQKQLRDVVKKQKIKWTHFRWAQIQYLRRVLEDAAAAKWKMNRNEGLMESGWGKRFVDQSNHLPVVAPFTFQKKLRLIIKSEATIKREKEANIASKEVRYRRTAQYEEGATRLLSELVSRIITKRKDFTTLSYPEMKHLIASVYWSLRVYLNIDPQQSKLLTRDRSRERLDSLKLEMGERSRHQITGREQRAILRRQFQPATINPAPKSRRYKEDWLRAFYPKMHTMLLEDPVEYTGMPVSSRRTLRVVVHRDPKQWLSAVHTRTLEQRGHQLLTLRYSRATRRIDNAMRTTLRKLKNVWSPIADEKSATLLRAEEPADSFFARAFSTQSRPERFNLLFRHMRRARRFRRIRRRLSHCVSVQRRIRLKARSEALGRTGFITYLKSTHSSRIDPRALRIKSPRNRQYLLRLPNSKWTALDVNRNRTLYFGAIKARRRAALEAEIKNHADRIRAPRRSTYRPFARPTWRAESSLASFSALVRSKTPTRRQFFHLVERQKLLNKNIKAKAVMLFPVRPSKAREEKSALQNDKMAKLALLTDSTSRTYALRPHKSKENYVIETHRSVLQHRRASQRSPHLYNKKTNAAQGAMLLIKKFASKQRGKRTVHDTARRVVHEWSTKRFGVTRFTKKGRLLVNKQLRVDARYKLRRTTEHELTRKRFKITPQRAYRTAHMFSLHGRILPVTTQTKKHYEPHFRQSWNAPIAKAGYVGDRDAKKKLTLTGFSTFDKHRNVTWDALTLHRNKRERTVRDWLKHTSRWFRYRWKPKQPRDKKWPKIKPSAAWMPRNVWQEIRRRTRKLEWRESDEKFYRKGFRKAFSFSPQERRRAPWLEAIIYRRALYNTRRGEYRRYQFPREQKRLNWLQRVRKSLFPARRNRNLYIKGRRWPRLRMYNQRMFRGLFDLRNRSAARRHFRKLHRQRPPRHNRSGFAKTLKGLGDRLDNTLMFLGIAPTIFWAREVAPMGLIYANGRLLTDPAERLKPGVTITLDQQKINHFRHFFQPVLRYYKAMNRRRTGHFVAYPKNFTYRAGLRQLEYHGRPEEKQFRRNSRLNPRLFRWFALDSVRH